MQRLNALVRQGFLYVDHVYLLTLFLEHHSRIRAGRLT